MKNILLIMFLLCSYSACKSQTYGWINIGDRLPNTPSAVTVSDIAMIGDSIWITSGFGNYQNQTPGEIYFSSDRGKTFSIQTTKYGTHAIYMLDSKRGWCGGVEGQLYYTSDGGTNWERKVFGFGKTLMDIDFPKGSDTGICTGYNAAVKILTPTGLQSVNMHGYVSNIYSVSCVDRNHAFVAGAEIIGPVTNNTFLIDQSYPGTDGIYSIYMVDTLRGWCVGSPTAAGAWDSSGCMIIRTDDGHNWVEQVNPVKGKTGTLMAVKALNDMEAWAVGTGGVVIHTKDGGKNWVREAEGLTHEMLYGLHVVSSNEVYVTGNNRTLLRYGIIDDVKDNTNLNDIQIYPNPAENYIDISFSQTSFPIDTKESFKLFNSLGEQVFPKSICPLSKGARIEIEDFTKGVYFIRIDNRIFKFSKN